MSFAGVKMSAFYCIDRKQETLKSFLVPRTSDESTDYSTEVTPSESSQVTNSTCPICGVKVSTDNLIINQHIDECLNRSTIESVVLESSSDAGSSSKDAAGTELHCRKSCKRGQQTLTHLIVEDTRKRKKNRTLL